MSDVEIQETITLDRACW